MILQALADYYDRSGELAAPGWEYKRIPYVIEITNDGRFVQLTSLRFGPKTSDVTPSLVPQSESRSGTKSYESPNLLWDHTGFVLGHPKSDSVADHRMAALQLTHFKQRLADFSKQVPHSLALLAVHRFYEMGEDARVKDSTNWADCVAIKGCNVTFRLASSNELAVHEVEVRAAIDANSDNSPCGSLSVCLVTGEPSPIQRLHRPISGVGEKPAPLSAINNSSFPAFASFGKSQGGNFPVGHQASLKYATALNHLLQPSSKQKIRLSEAVLVFWKQRPDPELQDDWLAVLMGTDDPNANTRQVKALYEAVHTGQFAGARGENRFYVLGLSPNAARIAVRFWHSAPLKHIAADMAQWFRDLSIDRAPHHAEYPGLKSLLRAVVLQRKDDNIPPGLGGDVLRAIVTGGALPPLWLNLAVQRCRAEQDVPYLRAAVIKACLNRSIRQQHLSQQEFTAMLDPTNNNPGYLLGRLFAVLEKIQEESSEKSLNSTIRDRYYGAASSTPTAVFTTLMRLKNHHLSKLNNKGRVVNFEKLLAEIVGGISDFPTHMALPEQGRFAIGYYHQRQAFFKKDEPADGANITATPNQDPIQQGN